MKALWQLPHGELHPIKIPEEHWDTILVDFIMVELPNMHRFNMVMVVVDVLGKQAHFNECYTSLRAVGATWLYYQNIWWYHRTPRKYISDRGL
jgi:hypothetical protein